MDDWSRRLRFLWEEESPPEEVGPAAPALGGVSRRLRRATRSAVIGAVGITLMGQVIGIRLIAPVDAAPSYQSQCLAECDKQYCQCLDEAAKNSPKRRISSQAINSCTKQLEACKWRCRTK